MKTMKIALTFEYETQVPVPKDWHQWDDVKRQEFIDYWLDETYAGCMDKTADHFRLVKQDVENPF